MLTLGGSAIKWLNAFEDECLVSSPIFSSYRHPFLLLLPFPSRQLSSPITVALKQATVVR